MADGDIYEYMKLRQYLVGMFQKGNVDMPIPSERELARMFGCGRITASHALNDMVQEKYLIKRPRRGYFINPMHNSMKQRKQKIIGLLIYSGSNAFYDYDSMSFIENLYHEMLKYNVCSQAIASSKGEMLFNDICNSSLDGLIWFDADDKMEMFEQMHRECNVPVVGLFNSRKPSCGNYCFLDHYQEGYLKTQYLLERGCRNILCVSTGESWGLDGDRGYQAALEEAGIELKPELVVDRNIYLEKMPELFSRYAIDGVIARFHEVDEIRSYTMAQGIKIPEQLQVITNQFYYDWNPTMTTKPFKAIATAMMKQLWNMIEGKKTTMEKSDFQWKITLGISTK